MIKKFLAVLLLAAVCATGFAGAAFAIDYTFHYDNSVSAARNAVAKYAYEILNYNWYVNGTIKLWKRDEYRSYQYIRGIPYSLHTQMTFEGYKDLSASQKYEINGNGMQYGMACAQFVTDCMKQGFLLHGISMPNDGQTMFHKRGWKNQVSTIPSISERVWQEFAYPDDGYNGWSSAWNNLFYSAVIKNNYEAYKKLKRGDYLLNLDHVRLVIDNDGSKIKYIDQTAYWDGNNDVGTHIAETSYYYVAQSKYIPMYVAYPDDPGDIEPDPSSDPDNIHIDYNNFTSSVFRVYLRDFDTNGDFWLSKAEREAVKEINVQGRQVTSLVGIKYFPNLEYLYCNNVGLTGELDLSGLTKLVSVWCMDNQLTSLNVSNCTSLPELWAYNNKLTNLDVTGCTNLKKIVVYYNSFTSLSLMKCYSLEELWIGGCDSLKYLECYGKVDVNGVEKPTITTESLPDGYVGIPYSAQLKATAKVSPISYGLSSVALANGLNYDYYTGVITGTPKYERTFTTTASVRNAGGLTQKNFSITIHPKPEPPKITTTSLPSGTVGTYYEANIYPSGTDTIITKATGELPPGLAISKPDDKYGRMLISGTPTQSGTYSIEWKATNAWATVGLSGEPEYKTLSIVINPKSATPVSITTTSLKYAMSTRSYSDKLSASGGNDSYSWSRTGGTAAWAKVDSAGNITGTPDNVSSRTSQTLNVKVSSGGATAPKTLPIYVYPNLVINSLSPLSIESGSGYSAQLSASGGNGSYSWNKKSGASWLSVNSSGKITGTAPSVTSKTTYSITVEVSSVGYTTPKTFSITVNPVAVVKPVITTTSLPAGTTGTAYSKTLSASGTTPITWTASGLPAGLTCSSGGVISGTPNTAWSGSVTIKATNSAGTTPKALPLTINAAATKPTILTTSLPAGTTGTAYSTTLSASGTTPMTWTASGLPAGLTCSSGGVISGTPKTAWSGSVTIKATNSAGTSTPKTLPLTINAAATKPTILTTSLPAGTTGTAYNKTLSASGTAPITWSKTGGTASWASVSSVGKITGKPTKAGTFTLTVKAANSAGSVSKSLKIVVKEATPIIKTTSLANGTVKKSYSASLNATGSNIKWSKTGGTATWAKVSSTGKITGTPTKDGTFTLTVKATNSGGNVSKSLKIVVKDVKPVIKTTSLANGTVKKSYSASLNATGSNITWSKTGGTATWAKVSSTGKITGTPTKDGTFTLTVKAANSGGNVSKSLKIVVKDVKPVIKTTSLANGTVKKSYSASLNATGTNITWSKTGGTATWAKVSSTGKITGTPTKAETFTLTVRAKNSAGSASKTLKIKVVSVSTASTASDRGEAEKFKDYEEFEDYVDDEPEDEIENKGSEYNAVLSLVSSDDVKFIFSLGSWTDVNGKALQVKSEDLTVYINYEPNENIKVNDENIFEILSKDINFEAGSAVYVEAAAGSEDALTSNIVDLGSASANNDSGKQGGSSGCSSGVYSLALLLALAALRKFKK